MSAKSKTIFGAVSTVVGIGISLWGLFLDHPAVLDGVFAWSPLWLPALMFITGLFTGYNLCIWRSQGGGIDEMVDNLVVNLPKELHNILQLIYRNGGSKTLPMCPQISDLALRKLLNVTQEDRSSTTCYCTLPTAVMRHFRNLDATEAEKEE